MVSQKTTKQQKVCRSCQNLLTKSNWLKSSRQKRDYICLYCKRKEFKAIKPAAYKYAKSGEKYDVSKSTTEVPRIDLKEDVKKDSGLILKMIKDTEIFRIDKMLSALKKTSDVATQYEIIVYLLKSFDELLPEQQASIINEANKLFKGATLIDKATVRLAKVLKGFTGTKKADAPKKFEQIIKDSEEDTIIEI